MSLLRDLPFTVRAAEDTIFITCSDPMSTAGSTAGTRGLGGSKTSAGVVTSTGDLGSLTTAAGTKLISSGGLATLNGRTLDRLRIPGSRAHYQGVVASAHLNSTRGSTEADRKLAVGLKLQHGDSSAAGDMADYSTDSQPDDQLYFGSSVRTCDMLTWDLADESTGAIYLHATGYYDLRAAKRYIRVVGRFGKDLVTTESSGDEQCRVSMDATFVAGDQVLKPDTTSPFSSSTSTA